MEAAVKELGKGVNQMDNDWLEVIGKMALAAILLAISAWMIGHMADVINGGVEWRKFKQDHHCVSVREEWDGNRAVNTYRCDNGQEITR